MIYHLPLNVIDQQKGVHIQWSEPNPSAQFQEDSSSGGTCECPYGDDEGPEALLLKITPSGGGDPYLTVSLSRTSGCSWFGEYTLHCEAPDTDIELTASVELNCDSDEMRWVATWRDINQGEFDCIVSILAGEKFGGGPAGTYDSTSGYGVEVTTV